MQYSAHYYIHWVCIYVVVRGGPRVLGRTLLVSARAWGDGAGGGGGPGSWAGPSWFPPVSPGLGGVGGGGGGRGGWGVQVPGLPGPKPQDTRGECNHLLSGRLPTVRQAISRCQRCTQKAYALQPKVSAYMHPASLNNNNF